MKWFLILLLFPFFSVAQTVHTEDGRVAYKGSVKTNLPFGELNHTIEKVLHYAGNKKTDWDSSGNEITVTAEMKLSSDQSIINRLQYQLKLTKQDDGYHYKIDSVKLVQKERGYKTTIIPSEELIKNLDNTGPVATITEKQLNEIDMRFEQLIDLLNNYSKKD